MRIRPKRRARLTPQESESLKKDIEQREQLRSVMSANSLDVLGLEYNVSTLTIIRLDRRGPVETPHTKLPKEVMEAIYARRRIYWKARELHDAQFSRKVIMERFNISSETFLRWLHVLQQEQRQVNQELRRAA